MFAPRLVTCIIINQEGKQKPQESSFFIFKLFRCSNV